MPPTDSMASAISREVRVVVPSSSRRLDIIASPAFSSESWRAPVSTLTLSATAGIEGFSTSSTINPFARTWRCTSKDLRIRGSVAFIRVLLIVDRYGAGFIVSQSAVWQEVTHGSIVRFQEPGTGSGNVRSRDCGNALDIGVDV